MAQPCRLRHTELMADALKKAGKPVQIIVLDGASRSPRGRARRSPGRPCPAGRRRHPPPLAALAQRVVQPTMS
jgi:hypothetical protein